MVVTDQPDCCANWHPPNGVAQFFTYRGRPCTAYSILIGALPVMEPEISLPPFLLLLLSVLKFRNRCFRKIRRGSVGSLGFEMNKSQEFLYTLSIGLLFTDMISQFEFSQI
jgi:hypothetical protein